MIPSTAIRTVYLDSNVIIDMCEGRREQLRSAIFDAAETGKASYPFSAAQISEIAKHPLTDRCKQRLIFLGSLSRERYFVHSVHDYGFRVESPFSVWDTLTEVLPDLDVTKVFSNLLPFETIRHVRLQLGLDPNYLNNLSGREAVAAINRAIANSVPDGAPAPRTIKEILDATSAISRQQFATLWSQMKTTEEHMTAGDDLLGVFSILEALGYWPDSRAVYKKGSRFTDSQHLFAASHCDALITSDIGMKNRAEASYAVMGIGTEVMQADEYAIQLRVC